MYDNNVLVEVYIRGPQGPGGGEGSFVEIAPTLPGAVFWGVFETGSEPTPPVDGKVHYGFRIPSQ